MKTTGVYPFSLILLTLCYVSCQNDVLIGCGGFVKSDIDIDYTQVKVQLITKYGSVKDEIACAPTSGYFMIPIYDKGEFTLKVSPPQNWDFDPTEIKLNIDGKTDPCSNNRDINFTFKGITITGRILSEGLMDGPAGVAVTLSQGDTVVQTTKSTDGGRYVFHQVKPGHYEIKTSHDKWTFSKSQTTIDAKIGSTSVTEDMFISGYDVQADVMSDGLPIQGVRFFLYQVDSKGKVTECDSIEKNLATPGQINGLSPLCYRISDQQGLVNFPSLPPGQYILVPYYRSEEIVFDVVPAQVPVTVASSSVKIQPNFQVHGFTIGGRVLAYREGKGIVDASIQINGKPVTSTGKDGKYLLVNVTSGTYTITVSKPYYFFEPFVTKITPSTPALEDIVATRYNLCGLIEITDLPNEVMKSKKRKVNMSPVGSKSTEVTILSNENGSFCFQVSPGEYIVKAVPDDDDKSKGVMFTPPSKQVTVKDEPVFGVKFGQFKTTVSGKVKFLDGFHGNKDTTIYLRDTERSGHVHQAVAKLTGDNLVAQFIFEDVLPGKYNAAVTRKDVCWKSEELPFTVLDKDIDGIQFEQNGFVLSAVTSHSFYAYYSSEGDKEKTECKFNKGLNRMCLPNAGRYEISPASCYIFQQNEYSYDTTSTSTLSMTAVDYRVIGSVISFADAKDIMIKIKFTNKEKEDIVLGPLEARPLGQLLKFDFQFILRPGDSVSVLPSSETLLFDPSKIDFTLNEDKECPISIGAFDASKGEIIVGKIEPVVNDVEIRYSNSKHFCPRFGPLAGNKNYDVTASKPGYVFTPTLDNKRDFKASKQGEIVIKVASEDGQPMSGVLFSLSGQNFRSNNITSETGEIQYLNLPSAQYYFRPLLKEYSFEPAMQLISVDEGMTVNVEVKGYRVAYSCYGKLSSLNGEPEVDVVVRAIGINNCENSREEATTTINGTFRIRGLKPNCSYSLQVAEENSDIISRSIPDKRVIEKVEDQDITDVNIITIRSSGQMEISGTVFTEDKYLHTIKALLYNENNMDSPVQSVALGVNHYFHFKPLPKDGKSYILRIQSMLSLVTYSYKTLETDSFTATQHRRHFHFNFSAAIRQIDPEPSQGSFLIIPFILVIAIAFNFTKVSQYVKSLIEAYNSRQQSSTSEENVKAKKKHGKHR
ncbi:Nodal modulator 3 [Trichoplax sp. H2]|nr:Nodal modulator 3 [Trichoplax sp. H2]|eukprot:RDD39674.1 Nodal modulator 3 [Trichoplax sp. H2]